jgi:hypothetical protein
MMKLLTILFGIVLTGLGFWSYTVEGAWLPSVLGLLVILFGLWQGRWKHNYPIFGAVMMGILSVLGAIRAWWNLIVMLTGGPPALSNELILTRSVRGLVSLVFIIAIYFMMKNFWPQWKKFGQFLGDGVGRAALTVFYFTIFVPFGIGVRLFSDPLQIKSQPDKLWRPRPTGDQKPEDVVRQF